MYVQVMQIRAASKSEVVWQAICSYDSILPIMGRGSRTANATLTLASSGTLDIIPRTIAGSYDILLYFLLLACFESATCKNGRVDVQHDVPDLCVRFPTYYRESLSKARIGSISLGQYS